MTAHLTNPFSCGGSADCDSLSGLFKAIVEKILLPIGSVMAVIAFIWTGFLFVMAQGEPTKLDTAKKALLYTVIGTAVLLGATAIANVIGGTINQLK